MGKRRYLPFYLLLVFMLLSSLSSWSVAAPVLNFPVASFTPPSTSFGSVVPPSTPTLLPEPLAANLDWAMDSYDAAGTNYNIDEHRLTPPLRLLWTRRLPTGYYADAITVSNGRVAVAGMSSESHNQIHMLDAVSGEILWSFTLDEGNGAMSFAPVFGEQDVFFGGQSDSNLYAVNIETGEVDWQLSGFSGFYSSEFVIQDSNLYIPDNQNGIALLDINTQDFIWGSSTGAWGLPVALLDNRVFGVTSDTKTLFGFDSQTGQVLWTHQGFDFFTWIVASESYIYVNVLPDGTVGGTEIAALDPQTGNIQWTTDIGAEIARGLGGAALAEGILYVPVWQDSNGNGGVVAVDALNSNILWSFGTTGTGVTDLAVANSVVYVIGWTASMVYALDTQTGNLLWSAPLSGQSGISAAVANGVLYAASYDTMYAFGN